MTDQLLHVPDALDLSEWFEEFATDLAGYRLDVDKPWVEQAIADVIAQGEVQTAWLYWPDTFEQTIRALLEDYWAHARADGFVDAGGFLDHEGFRSDLWEECVVQAHATLTEAYADAAIAQFLDGDALGGVA